MRLEAQRLGNAYLYTAVRSEEVVCYFPNGHRQQVAMVGSPAVRTRATCLAQLSIAAARVRIYSPLKGSVRVSMLEQYKKILVTGGCGFIGSHLVDALLSLGKAVTVIDNLSSGSEKNLIPEVRLKRGDVRDSGQVSEAMKGAELVFHVAANANGTRSINDPGFDFETNAAGTFNVLQAAVGGSVKKGSLPLFGFGLRHA